MADIKAQKKGDRATVTLGGELTVRYARELKTALLDAVRTASKIEVVLGAVVRVDSSFPQLLYSAQRAAEAMHKTMTVTGAEQGLFADALRRGGFIRGAGSRGSTGMTYPWLRGPAAK
jgi:ABC-type transporter Mla MlaB component